MTTQQSAFSGCPYYLPVTRARKGIGHEKQLCTLTGQTCLVDPPDKTYCMRHEWYQAVVVGKEIPRERISKLLKPHTPEAAEQGQLL